MCTAEEQARSDVAARGIRTAIDTALSGSVAPDETATLTVPMPGRPNATRAPDSDFTRGRGQAEDPNEMNRPEGSARHDRVSCTQFGDGVVRIYGSDGFQETVASDIERLRRTTTGRAMLDCMVHIHERRHHVIRIYSPSRGIEGSRWHNGFSHPANLTTGAQDEEADRRAGFSMSRDGAERGTSTHIYYNPTCITEYNTGSGMHFKGPWLVLAHELVHAIHFAHGVSLHRSATYAADAFNFPNAGDGGTLSGAEEEFTIVGEYETFAGMRTLVPNSVWTESLTENALLREIGYPERVDHCTIPSCTFRDGSAWYRYTPGRELSAADPPTEPANFGDRTAC
jgi:hypothetical protein